MLAVGRNTIGQLLRYGVSSGASAAVSVGLPVFLHEAFGVEQKVAVAISQVSVLLLNFLMIRIFVFRSNGRAKRDLASYVGSAVVFRSLEYLCFLCLFEVLELYYLTALVTTLTTSTLVKFFWYRYLFRGKPADGVQSAI